MRRLERVLARPDDKVVDHRRNLLPPLVQRDLVAVAAHAPHLAAGHAREPAHLPRLGHKLADELALAVGALDKLHVGAKRDILQDAPARRARRKAAGVVDLGVDIAAAAAAPHHGRLRVVV